MSKYKDQGVYIYSYKEVREMISASVRLGGVDGAIKKMLDGKKVVTKYGTYWATQKDKKK